MTEKIKRFFWNVATSGLKDAIWMLKLLGLNDLATKLQEKRAEYVDSQANNEDVPAANTFKWFIYIVLAAIIIINILKIFKIKLLRK